MQFLSLLLCKFYYRVVVIKTSWFCIIFLMEEGPVHCRQCHPWLGGTGCIRIQVTEGKPLYIFPPGLEILLPDSSSELLPWFFWCTVKLCYAKRFRFLKMRIKTVTMSLIQIPLKTVFHNLNLNNCLCINQREQSKLVDITQTGVLSHLN